MRWQLSVVITQALTLFVSCGKSEPAPTATEIFEAELQRRGVEFVPQDDEGVYTLMIGDGEATISLSNITRDYQRDRDPGAIVRFVERVLDAFELPAWEAAQSCVYLMAESADYDFGDTIYTKVSDSVCKVLVLANLEEGRITWLTPDILAEWKVPEVAVRAAAEKNMNRLLAGKRPETREVAGMKLGMVPVDSIFRASVIFAPDFKEFVSTELEWPVLAVLPCRDFIYVLPEKDEDLLSRMGGVVLKEYRGSGYPITTEILRISDEGVEAIGHFAE